MSDDNDLIKLYSSKILALAADISRTDRLDSPMASVKKRSPLCGSSMTVDVNVENGVVTGYGQDVKACALGQAAASVVGEAIIGTRVEQVITARDEMAAMLKQNGPVPSAPFEGLAVMEPARDFKNRHASILLALDASVEAIAQIQAKEHA